MWPISKSKGSGTPVPPPAPQRVHAESRRDSRIRERAYEIYLERGKESGKELDDWLQAEQEEMLLTVEQRPNR